MPVLGFQADDALRQVRYRLVPAATVKGISNEFHKKDGEGESCQNPLLFVWGLTTPLTELAKSGQICWAQGCGAERSPSRSAKQQIGLVGGRRWAPVTTPASEFKRGNPQHTTNENRGDLGMVQMVLFYPL